MFLSNFATQKSVLLFGVVATLQPLCRCQKQPCTKTTVLCRGSTRSGLPGRSGRCSRYRSPLACRSLRSTISGLVFRPRILDILSDRWAFVKKSVMPPPLRSRVRLPHQLIERLTTNDLTGRIKRLV
jgi:hypothetical protein